MRAAAATLLGRHDFSALRAADCPARTTVREIRRLEITPGVEVIIEATAFLKHMVRNIVGTLVEVGHGRRDPRSLPALLEGRDRTRAGPTAPPHGLCLDEVFYLEGNANPHEDAPE
jgi:tRNA pseudouridine38-40 synthase